MAHYETRGTRTRAVAYLNGERQARTFDTKREAQSWVRDLKLKDATDGPAVGGTNEELFEIYAAISAATDSKKWNLLRLAKFAADPIAQLRTQATTTHDINAWIKRQQVNPSAHTKRPLRGSTIVRELNLMSGAFGYALKSLRWITVNLQLKVLIQ